MAQDIHVPDIGDFKEVEVIDVLVKPDDRIDVDTPLVTIETEKATMDVPSPAAGVVKSIAIKKGERVSKGSLILVLDSDAAAPASAPEPAPVATPTAPVAAPSPSATTPAATSTELQITVPDIGDFKEVEVIDVLVKVGDQVEVDTPLTTLETEKATMDVPSIAAGKVKSIAIKKGDRISKGALILVLQSSAPVAAPVVSAPAATVPVAPALASASSSARVAPTPAGTSSAVNEAGFAQSHASPSVRRFARELGVDLSRVKGSGLKGRITPEDVKGFVKAALAGGATATTGGSLPKVPEVDFAKFGTVDIKPLSRIQKISGPRLHASWINVPHVWQMDEADITDLEDMRKKLKDDAEAKQIKLTPLAFIVKAVANSLKEYPTFNASLDANAQNLVMKKYCHIGFAADTPNGLVVPVIRDADRKDVYDIARDLATLSAKARDGKLSGAEMQGGCFTISSLGGIGGTSFTPIINAPEVAILGVAKSSMKPVFNATSGAFDARLILPFTLAYDHRVIDGALGARFTAFLAKQLTDVKTLLMAVPK